MGDSGHNVKAQWTAAVTIEASLSYVLPAKSKSPDLSQVALPKPVPGYHIRTYAVVNYRPAVKLIWLLHSDFFDLYF